MRLYSTYGLRGDGAKQYRHIFLFYVHILNVVEPAIFLQIHAVLFTEFRNSKKKNFGKIPSPAEYFFKTHFLWTP